MKKSVSIAIKIFSPVLLIVLTVFICSMVKRFGTEKRIFYFPVSNSEILGKEVRYLSKDSCQEKLRYYIDEILLGPETNRFRPLFSLGTTVDFCVLEQKKLYLGLSEDVIFNSSESVNIQEGFDILKLNLQKNFPKIEEIIFFVNGYPAFE